MAMPEGAKTVNYTIQMYDTSSGGEVSLDLRFAVGLAKSYPPTEAARADAAVQAGCDAIIATLDAAYPGGTVTAERSYDLNVPGDPWPAGAQPLDGE